MTDEQMLVACAKACGFTHVMLCPGFACDDANKFPMGVLNGKSQPIPDYPNDLNACHEMEDTLLGKPGRLFEKYCKCLEAVAEDVPSAMCATAHQRCEAFLRTKGLWND